LEAVDQVNLHQKAVMLQRIKAFFDQHLAGKTIAIWGLSFKPRTDDIREAPALTLIDRLLEDGAKLQVHDPEALENVRAHYGDRLTYADKQYDALNGADCLAIMTEWKEFLRPDFAKMKRAMRSPVIFDGRNLYEPAKMVEAGFNYHSIGRVTVAPAK
jgi:UDPglucose 6-dehydrogenase